MVGLRDTNGWLLGQDFGNGVLRAEYFRLNGAEDYWASSKYTNGQAVAPLQHMKDFLYDYWMEHPEEFIALKARCKLGANND